MFTKEKIMSIGTVKWYNTKKGYGFISPIDNDKDVFVHACQLEKIGLKELKEHQKISYETYNDRGRIAAGNLKLL